MYPSHANLPVERLERLILDSDRDTFYAIAESTGSWEFLWKMDRYRGLKVAK